MRVKRAARPVAGTGRPPAGIQPLSMSAGAVLFRPTDECPGFVRVTSGAIKVSLATASGREIVLYRVTPGDVCLQTFGCLVEGRRYSAQGMAETALEAELIPTPEFDRLMATDPPFRAQLFRSIARRFADFERMVEALAFTALETRVAAALLRLADESGVVSATHEAIAVEIGSAREAVSRQLALFARDGLIAQGRGRIRVVDRPAVVRAGSRPQ